MTGTLKKLENFKSNAGIGVRMEFCKIWGVGPKRAHELAAAGYKYCSFGFYIRLLSHRSIDDLRDRGMHLLTKQQRIGITRCCCFNLKLTLMYRFEDLQERIPRQEIDEIKSIVFAAADMLLPGIYFAAN